MPLTIVVADDSPDYRDMVRHLLASVADAMTIVGEAADGEEALSLVRLHRPDLVITDLIMPRLNGIELTRHIRQELPQTRIILMSSYTEDAYRLMASDSGADVFVSKWVIHDALLPAIRDLIRRISARAARRRSRVHHHRPQRFQRNDERDHLRRARAGGAAGPPWRLALHALLDARRRPDLVRGRVALPRARPPPPPLLARARDHQRRLMRPMRWCDEGRSAGARVGGGGSALAALLE